VDDAEHKAFLDSLVDPASLYENAPCGYFSFTPTGQVIKINKTLLDWLGYDREQIVYTLNFTDLISRGGKIYYEMFYFPLLQLQSAVNEINFDFIRKDGSRFPALVNSMVIRSEDAELLAINATIYDITDRKRYEAELLESKKLADAERIRFEFLSDFIPDMIWTASAEGKLNYVNKRFRDFFELPATAIDISNIFHKVHSKDRYRLLSSWVKAIRSGLDYQSEVRLLDGMGDFQWYLVRAVAFKSDNGKIIKWMGASTNINTHVTAIEKLDEFISVASHELKTPITALLASLQVMQKFKDSESGMKIMPRLIEQSHRSALKINELISDLLNTGNLKEGQMVLNVAQVNVAELLHATCPHVASEGVFELVVICDPGLVVIADENRIDQVLVNFVNNAVKYAPGSKRIFLTAEVTDGNLVKISVRDTGPGIAAERVPYVFDRYYRVSNAGHQYSGLGLGLYICAEIVRRHDGKIGVNSKLGEGSEFWFTLPMATASK
jgi:PAS domain S-box-containing protein